jgi:hypothetical protein
MLCDLLVSFANVEQTNNNRSDRHIVLLEQWNVQPFHRINCTHLQQNAFVTDDWRTRGPLSLLEHGTFPLLSCTRCSLKKKILTVGLSCTAGRHEMYFSSGLLLCRCTYPVTRPLCLSRDAWSPRFLDSAIPSCFVASKMYTYVELRSLSYTVPTILLQHRTNLPKVLGVSALSPLIVALHAKDLPFPFALSMTKELWDICSTWM